MYFYDDSLALDVEAETPWLSLMITSFKAYITGSLPCLGALHTSGQ